MKPPVKLLFAACLTTFVAATTSTGTTAAESEASVQDLVQVRASTQVVAAHWTRRPDVYVLQVALDRSRSTEKRASAPGTEAPTQLAPQNRAPAPQLTATASPDTDRAQFFIGNTIANLRGLDPWFTCGRTLTLVEGRRAPGQPPAPPRPDPALAYMNQPYPPKFKERRVEVWLLKADGTQILPTTYSCDMGPTYQPTPVRPVEISYEFPLADSEQAVAAAIRIDDEYYIEKLKPQSR